MRGDDMREFRKQKFSLKSIIPYIRIDGGRLKYEPVMRHRSIALQMVLGPWFCTCTCLTLWLLSGESFLSKAFFMIPVIFNVICFIYFTTALYLSLRDNLPKMVSKKNSMGLFLFTLLFFEAGVMTLLFWVLYLVLTATDTPLCRSLLCSGILSGVFGWINILTLINIAVLWHSRRNLGISLVDAFGI
mmetsp:Transcript_9293/g.10277  ORF Transcript_9293/g.10277 Transcript_9293/m.10277 type:complete len:188 (-) Transcript_9293:76-639(-)